VAGTYWSAKYWGTNYWGADYWTENATGTPGDHWNPKYWGANYWGANYWAIGDPGAIFQNVAGQRTLSAFNAVLETGPIIQATTPTLSLSALVTDTANDVSFTATLPTRTLTAQNHVVDNIGYQLGDISFTVFASSGITWTDTVSATAPSRTLTAPFHAVNTGANVTVNVQSTPVRTLSALPHSVANTVSISLTTPVKQLTALNVTTGIGTVLRASAPVRTLTARQPNLLAAGGIITISTTTPVKTLSALTHEIDSFPTTVPVPDRTYPIDFIANGNATEYPSFYDICERTGFRVKPGTLVTEWNGTKVRPESYEARHPQDFVRSRAEKQEGSERPEQDDRFIQDLYPTGLSASDL